MDVNQKQVVDFNKQYLEEIDKNGKQTIFIDCIPDALKNDLKIKPEPCFIDLTIDDDDSDDEDELIQYLKSPAQHSPLVSSWTSSPIQSPPSLPTLTSYSPPPALLPPPPSPEIINLISDTEESDNEEESKNDETMEIEYDPDRDNPWSDDDDDLDRNYDINFKIGSSSSIPPFILIL